MAVKQLIAFLLAFLGVAIPFGGFFYVVRKRERRDSEERAARRGKATRRA